jgi:hypothetical protein
MRRRWMRRLRRCTLYEVAVDETAVAMDETAGMKRAL